MTEHGNYDPWATAQPPGSGGWPPPPPPGGAPPPYPGGFPPGPPPKRPPLGRPGAGAAVVVAALAIAAGAVVVGVRASSGDDAEVAATSRNPEGQAPQRSAERADETTAPERAPATTATTASRAAAPTSGAALDGSTSLEAGIVGERKPAAADGYDPFDAGAPSPGNFDEATSTPVLRLAGGDCFDLPGLFLLFEVQVLPCDRPHEAQVYAVLRLDGPAEYPGGLELERRAKDTCSRLAGPGAGPGQELGVHFLRPDRLDWERGVRALVCSAYGTKAPLEGPLPAGWKGAAGGGSGPAGSAPTTAADDERGANRATVDLEVGDCFERPDRRNELGQVEQVEVVSCDEPHEAEVFYVFDTAADHDGSYPGQAALEAEAQSCRDHARRLVSEDPGPGVGIHYMVPSEETWGHGDRAVVCSIMSLAGSLDRPLRLRAAD